MTESAGIALFPKLFERGAERFCCRRRDRNPHGRGCARDYYEAWQLGWDDADSLLERRGGEQAARWLRDTV